MAFNQYDTTTHDRYIPPKPGVIPTVYGFVNEYNSPRTAGAIKIGYTTRTTEVRIREEFVKNPEIKPKVVFERIAVSKDGYWYARTPDKAVRDVLVERLGCDKLVGEWVRCTVDDVDKACQFLYDGTDPLTDRRSDFKPRMEQRAAIGKTACYFRSCFADGIEHPRFLWNAKMRFGKTITACWLAKELGFKRVLVVSFKTEVKDSWRKDLNNHVDFEGWQFVDAKRKTSDPLSLANADLSKPTVAFISFQDLLGRDKDTGGIKVKNQLIHDTDWDLVILDEYHFGAWNDSSQSEFDGYETGFVRSSEDELLSDNGYQLPIKYKCMLCLSGTPFRALMSGEFGEEQTFTWSYADEQRAKREWDDSDGPNPYAMMPEMTMLTYRLPEQCTQLDGGETSGFSLNEFFRATGEGKDARFVHEDAVSHWLKILHGAESIFAADVRQYNAPPVLPFFDANLADRLTHTIWYMPRVNSCHAMRNLMMRRDHAFYHDYEIVVAAGNDAGMGAEALKPVRDAMTCNGTKSSLETKTITLTCGKLTTGVTVPEWTGVFMLSDIASPESYFQTAFRVQSAWTAAPEHHGDAPVILKDRCYVIDFAPDRTLEEVVSYSRDINPDKLASAAEKVDEFVNWCPILSFDGASMVAVNGEDVLSIVSTGTTSSLLARKFNSPLLVNVDNRTLSKVVNDERAVAALTKIEGFRNIGMNRIKQVLNASNRIEKLQKDVQDDSLSKQEKKDIKREIDRERKEQRNARKEIREKLQRLVTRIPHFMYFTDYREQCLRDVITKIEPALFKKVTGLTTEEFEYLTSLDVFNAAQLNDAIARFRRYEEPSLSYLGIARHTGEQIGLWNASVSHEELHSL